MKVWDSILTKAGKGLSIQRSVDTRRLFAYLLLTGKNVSLYTEGYNIRTTFREDHFDHVLYKADDFFPEQAQDQIDSLSKPDTSLSVAEAEIDREDKPASPGDLAIVPASFVLISREQLRGKIFTLHIQ